MEPSKLPLEKLFFFVAGIIPGIVALLIFDRAVPGSFAWFFAVSFLGYKAKLSIILLTAFIIGNTLTTFLSAILGAMGGAIGFRMTKQPYQTPASYNVAPWRDMRWRVALRRYLAVQCPNDTTLIPEVVFNLRLQTIAFMPEADRHNATAILQREKLETEIDDGKWAWWYDHYHQKALLSRDKWDVQRHVAHGLSFNLETTAMYVLTAAAIVPSIRQWWCIVPATIWTLLLIADQYNSVRRFKDPWATLSEQIEYLSDEAIAHLVEPKVATN